MTGCPSVGPLLALSAAGLLDAPEERVVREHIRECPLCAAHLESLGNLASGLGALPSPAPPADLAFRTQARIGGEWDAVAQRRRGGILALAGAVLAWISWFATWELYRMLTAGFEAAFHPAWPASWAWLGFSGFMVLLTPAVAVALARARRRQERRLA